MPTTSQIANAEVCFSYLLRGLKHRIDWDKLGAERRRALPTELADFLIPAAIAARSTVEMVKLLCQRFEIRAAGEGWEEDDGYARRGRPAYALVPRQFMPPGVVELEAEAGAPWNPKETACVRWDHLAKSIDFAALRLAVYQNPQLLTTFALNPPVEGEEAVFSPWIESAMAPAWTPTLPERLLTPRAFRTVWTLVSNLAHGADHKSGNVTMFRRERRIDPTTGEQVLVPFMSGNAVRGLWRDMIFYRLLRLVGLRVEDIPPRIAHALLAGGTIEAGADSASVDVALRRRVRGLLPAWDLFAGVIEQQIMRGVLRVHDAQVVCRENAWLLYPTLRPKRQGSADVMSFEEFHAALPVADNLTQLRLLTRHAHRDLEDSDGIQMITDTEVLLPGTTILHSFQLLDPSNVSSLAASCMSDLILEFRDIAHTGAGNARGYGQIAFDHYLPGEGHDALPPTDEYLAYVRENRDAIRAFLLGEKNGEVMKVDGVGEVKITRSGAKGRGKKATGEAT